MYLRAFCIDNSIDISSQELYEFILEEYKKEGHFDCGVWNYDIFLKKGFESHKEISPYLEAYQWGFPADDIDGSKKLAMDIKNKKLHTVKQIDVLVDYVKKVGEIIKKII